MDKLKIPTALGKNFPSREKRGSANNAGLTKQSINQEYLDKLKILMTQAKKFHHNRKQTVQSMCAKRTINLYKNR